MTEHHEAAICEQGGGGLILPLFGDAEQEASKKGRAFVYFFFLCYCFLGVNIISDYFMDAITAITSQRKRIVDKTTGRKMTVNVWNSTVANLTLLALGSSAPEIMLACMETMSRKMYQGALGPGTIVGSAAFNLLIIVPVCMLSIPVGQVQYIEQFEVYLVTVAFSLLAYVWLLFIVQVCSPDVIEVWEALLTVMFMPLLVGLSYYVDITNGCRQDQVEEKASLVEDGAAEGGATSDSEYVNKAVRTHVSKEVKRLSAVTGTTSPKSKGSFSHEEAEAEFCKKTTSLRQADNCKKPICDSFGRPIVCPSGVLAFATDNVDVNATSELRKVRFTVYRRNGVEGAIKCNFKVERGSAVPDYDYVDEKGSVEFEHGQTSAEIFVEILPCRERRPHRHEGFRLVLSDMHGDAMFNPYDDGGEHSAVLTVSILNESLLDALGNVGSVYLTVRDRFMDEDLFRLGVALWREQIISAVSPDDDEDSGEDNPQDGDDDKDDNKFAYCGTMFFHILALPWKILYAVTVPPALWFSGWLLFFVALLHIALSCAIIGDLASLFGCCAGVDDSITAITFVALGTSLPDMFASITAAAEEDSADASIVNVTGSNSVNVFLGIGLPWTICSLYWASGETSDEWKMKNPKFVGTKHEGAFIVTAGTLAFSVSMFCSLAVMALCVLRFKRLLGGGELGGNKLSARCPAAFMMSLWALYIIMSIWKSSSDNAKYGQKLVAGISFMMFCSLVVFEALVFLGRFKPQPLGGSSNEMVTTCEPSVPMGLQTTCPEPEPMTEAPPQLSPSEEEQRAVAAVKIQALHRGRTSRARVEEMRRHALESEAESCLPAPVSVGKPVAESGDASGEAKKKKKSETIKARASTPGTNGTTKKMSKKKADKDKGGPRGKSRQDCAEGLDTEDTADTAIPADSPCPSTPPESETVGDGGGPVDGTRAKE